MTATRAPIRARVSAIHRGTVELLFDTLHSPPAPSGPSRQSATLHASFRSATDARLRPCIGDWVLAHASGAGSWIVDSIEPRTSLLVRRAAGSDATPQPLAANVDLALLFAPLPDDVNVRRLARLAALVWDGGATPVVLLSRADLSDPDAIDAARREIARHCPGVPVVTSSAVSHDGLTELRPWLTSHSTVVLLGPSGAGKSTLVNALVQDTVARTGEASANGDGRHTTTHRELYQCDNGVTIIDTPGLREVGLIHDASDADGVDRLFDDITTLSQSCRYADCQHHTEPQCAVRAAVDAGHLDPDRLQHWQELRDEVDRASRSIAERRRIERQGSRIMRQFQSWRGDR